MKKFLTTILSFTIILTPVTTFAQTAPEKACEKFKVQFFEGNNPAQTWEIPSKMDAKTYEEQFEKAQEAYHNYVACMFEFAENTVYQTEGVYHGGSFKANTANSKVLDWMAPNQACLTPFELQKVFNQTTPTEMLGPVLDAQTDYKTYLELLLNTATLTSVEGNAVSQANFLEEAERNQQLEIESSMVALDLMFHSLKELRTAFVIHVQLQCTLKYLNKYRDALAKLRKEVEPLPEQLQDASITK